MLKPNGYDEVQAAGEFTPVELGGHYCVIKQVKETTSKTGKPMIVVCIDFCSPDKQENYFMDSFKDDVRPDKKWPHNGTIYILTQNYQDPNKVSRNFKTFCTCVEKSNSGFEIQWGDNWGAQFKGKKIGAVYGEVENEYNGKTSMRHELRWFCSWDRVDKASVPDPKMLNNSSAPASTAKPSTDADGFMNVPQGADDEIPF